MPPPDLHGASLLAVTAHPDDESILCGGLLARCAASGAVVDLLCLTRGEHGCGTGDVGVRRRAELAAAADTLGLTSTTVLTFEDGMLPWLDAAAIEDAIARVIRRRRPEVVVTFDADGVYGHPDHVAVHERTTAVVARLGGDGPALFFGSIPRGAMRRLADHVAARRDGGAATRATVILGIDDPDAWGAEAPRPTLVIEARRFAVTKLAALACHRTQFEDSALAALTDRDARRFLGREQYRRAAVGRRGPAFIERLVPWTRDS